MKLILTLITALLLVYLAALIARNFLFNPLGSLPAEGPGSEGVR